MKYRDGLTFEQVMAAVYYDPETGIFRQKVHRGERWPVGRELGSRNHNGYLTIYISGKSYMSHRLAWLIMTGKWPEETIDHINGNPADNRIANLRAATVPENLRSRRKPVTNTSGYKGVSWSASRNRWQAQIAFEGKTISLGFFLRPDDAHKAYCRAARRLHGEFAKFA